MAITTKLQTKYSLQKILVIALSLGMGLWGLYDYRYKIPLRQRVYERGQVCFKVKQGIETALSPSSTPAEINEALDAGAAAVTDEVKRLIDMGATLPTGRIDAAVAMESILLRDETLWAGLVPLFDNVLSSLKSSSLPIGPETTAPPLIADTFLLVQIGVDKTADISPPGKFDRATQWMFMACLPFVPYFAWSLYSVKRRTYRLDDDGTLHAPEGSWANSDIADIDMSRWMSKSIAFVVNNDGNRIKLDDYIYCNCHLIVGQIASEKYPTEWHDNAKPVKAAPATEGEPGSTGADPADDGVEADGPKTPAEV